MTKIRIWSIKCQDWTLLNIVLINNFWSTKNNYFRGWFITNRLHLELHMVAAKYQLFFRLEARNDPLDWEHLHLPSKFLFHSIPFPELRTVPISQPSARWVMAWVMAAEAQSKRFSAAIDKMLIKSINGDNPETSSFPVTFFYFS